MNDVNMDKSKRKSLKKRNLAKSKPLRTHSNKLSAYRQGKAQESPMAKGAIEGQGSPADREYKRMLGGDVYRGASKKSNQQNQSKRRYK